MIPGLKFVIPLVFILGALLFFVKQDWILFDFPTNSYKETVKHHPKVVSRKKVKLFGFNDNIYFDESNIVWQGDDVMDLQSLVTSWLLFVHDESIIDRKVSLNFVSITENTQEAYVSFDSPVLSPEWSIRKKWMFIESLLKTIYEAKLHVQKVLFFVRNNRIFDDHLDFSISWPIYGYIKN